MACLVTAGTWPNFLTQWSVLLIAQLHLQMLSIDWTIYLVKCFYLVKLYFHQTLVSADLAELLNTLTSVFNPYVLGWLVATQNTQSGIELCDSATCCEIFEGKKLLACQPDVCQNDWFSSADLTLKPILFLGSSITHEIQHTLGQVQSQGTPSRASPAELVMASRSQPDLWGGIERLKACLTILTYTWPSHNPKPVQP